ncbi:uncharacterized protein DNG_07192 [Cephalotrichum gorgonifer]|uniref:Uncharacterized protein n=1 Tax=Cephalotrichum gorgonifer TaxID=2041049 RepID=A0AAE8N203_9PEZI|nr:uncharacterized protein DNG_07192 [Cephalotrichum gorgonifer]
MSHCQNLPVFDNGPAILAEIAALREGMNKRLDNVTHRIDALGARVDALGADMDRMNTVNLAERYNAMAKVENNWANSRNSTLVPLRTIVTNAPIPNFPPTSAALRSLNDATATAILEALGLSTNGSVEDKQARLRVASGIAFAIE